MNNREHSRLKGDFSRAAVASKSRSLIEKYYHARAYFHAIVHSGIAKYEGGNVLP